MDLLFICLKLDSFKLQTGLLVSLSFSLRNAVVFTSPPWSYSLNSGHTHPQPFQAGAPVVGSPPPPVYSCPIADVPLSLLVRVQQFRSMSPQLQCGMFTGERRFLSLSLFFSFPDTYISLPLGWPGVPRWLDLGSWRPYTFTGPGLCLSPLPSPLPDFPCPPVPTPRPSLTVLSLHSCSRLPWPSQFV